MLDSLHFLLMRNKPLEFLYPFFLIVLFVSSSVFDYFLPITGVYNIVRALIVLMSGFVLLNMFYRKWYNSLTPKSLYSRLGIKTRLQISIVCVFSLLLFGIGFSRLSYVYTVSNSIITCGIMFMLLFARYSDVEKRRVEAEMVDSRDKSLLKILFPKRDK